MMVINISVLFRLKYKKGSITQQYFTLQTFILPDEGPSDLNISLKMPVFFLPLNQKIPQGNELCTVAVVLFLFLQSLSLYFLICTMHSSEIEVCIHLLMHCIWDI